MGNYSTISVPEEVKKRLEQAKNGKDWGEYLLELYIEADRAKRVKGFEKLVKALSDKDLESILESSKEFRESLEIR